MAADSGLTLLAVDAGDKISLGAALLAAVVAVVVPVWTFRMTLAMDRLKWVRDQRSQLYIDMLTEAYAEKQWFTERMSRLELEMIDKRYASPDDAGRRSDDIVGSPDLRLNPIERAKLGSRGTVFASPAVSKTFNAVQAAMGHAMLVTPKLEAEVHAAKWKVEEAFETFQKTVQDELDARSERLKSESWGTKIETVRLWLRDGFRIRRR